MAGLLRCLRATAGSLFLFKKPDNPTLVLPCCPQYEGSMQPLPVIALVTLSFTFVACVAGGPMPKELKQVPGSQPAVAARLRAARLLLDHGKAEQALTATQSILEQWPGQVNAERLRQEILRQRGRLGLLLYEAEERLRQHPQQAGSHYLAGRIQNRDTDKLRAFQEAVRLQPDFFWGWFGLAFMQRGSDPEQAAEIYQGLHRAAKGEPTTALAYAQQLRSLQRDSQAAEVYAALALRRPGLSALGLSETLLHAGKVGPAWAQLLRGLQHRPFDASVRRQLAHYLGQGISDRRVQEFLSVLQADAQRLQTFVHMGGAGMLAELLHRSGQSHAALEFLQGQQHENATVRRLWQQLLLVTGDLPAMLADLRSGYPAELLADESNQVRGLWLECLEGPWMQATDPLADLQQGTALAQALTRVGLLEVAQSVISMLMLRHAADGSGADGSVDELQALRAELWQEIAFEQGLRSMLEQGYAKVQAGKGAMPMGQFLVQLRQLSQQTLGRDVVGAEPALFQVLFVGQLLDSFGPGLAAHLARYNKHLVLGQRAGSPVEGMLLTRLYLGQVDPIEGLPLPPRCREVVGEHRQITPMVMQDLAGIALLNHYVIDMDEVRKWAGDLLQRRRLARQDGLALLRDPLPAYAPALDPAGVEWRLTLLSPVQDSDMQAAVLDLVRWHERVHMADFFHFLPSMSHPLRSIGLLWRNGFSPESVAGEMEARAELGSLAFSPHSRLVLAHIASFLMGEAGGSPHAAGFRDLAQDILQAQKRRQIEGAKVLDWHRLEPRVAQEIGQELLRYLW